MIRFRFLLLAGLTSACASYHPAPLGRPRDVLAPPDAAGLSRRAEAIDRPYLKPRPIDLGAPLTPDALALIAVVENPDLKAERTKVGVATAQAFAARLLPDPSFQANFDKLLSGPDSFNGVGAQLAFDLNQLRTARVTRQTGEANSRQVRLDVAWAEWNVAGQARLQGARVLALTGQLAVARESASSAERLFAVTQRAAARGDVPASDLDTRRQALVDAGDKARTAERDLATARADLNALLGLPPETVIALAPAGTPPVPPPGEALTARAIDRRLDLQALRAGYEAAEGELHTTVLEQFPNLSLTLSGAADTSNNRTFGPAVGFTLPLWNRNRGAIAVARATREQLRAEYDARLHQTRSEIGAAVAGLALLRGQREALAAQMPALERYAETTRRAAEHGDLAPATAEAAMQAMRDRRLALLQTDQQISEQTIALELLTGEPSEGWTQ